MRIIAVNASPRKNWNTALVLEKALEGAAGARLVAQAKELSA